MTQVTSHSPKQYNIVVVPFTFNSAVASNILKHFDKKLQCDKILNHSSNSINLIAQAISSTFENLRNIYTFPPSILPREICGQKVVEIHVFKMSQFSDIFLLLIKAKFPDSRTGSIRICLSSFRSERNEPAPQH